MFGCETASLLILSKMSVCNRIYVSQLFGFILNKIWSWWGLKIALKLHNLWYGPLWSHNFVTGLCMPVNCILYFLLWWWGYVEIGFIVQEFSFRNSIASSGNSADSVLKVIIKWAFRLLSCVFRWGIDYYGGYIHRRSLKSGTSKAGWNWHPR